MNNTRTEMKIFETLDDNIVLIDGVKYQKVEEPKSLYEMLDGFGSPINRDYVCDTVEKWLNDNRWNCNGEYFSGWNDCIGDLKLKIK